MPKLLAAFILALFLQSQLGAQDKPADQLEELRRQLQAERAARKALTYQADMRKAAQLVEGEHWVALQALLKSYEPQPGENDPRSWEWHFLQSLVRKKRIADQEELVLEGVTKPIHQLHWCGNGQRLGSVDEEGKVTVWDAKNGKKLAQFGSRLRVISWSPDGKWLTASHEIGSVQLCEAGSGRKVREFPAIPGVFALRFPAFAPDSRLVALALDATSAVIVEAATGKELRRLKGPAGFASELVWRPDGNALATGGSDGKIRIWDADTGKESGSLDGSGSVVSLGWRTDGRQIAAVTSSHGGPGHVQAWDLPAPAPFFTAEYRVTSFLPGRRTAELIFSPAGDRICVASQQGLSVWETATARALFHSPGGAYVQFAGVCNPQGTRWAFLQMYGTQATCRVIDIDTYAELLRVTVAIPINHYQSALAWSADGSRLATGFSDGKVRVYSVPKEMSGVRTLDVGAAGLFQWSPDGRRYALLRSAEAFLGALPPTKPLTRLGPAFWLPSVASLSPDGRFLAGADGDGSIPIWDIAKKQVTQRLPGHPQPLLDPDREGNRLPAALIWSPDGKLLASLRNSDGGLIIWDVEANRPKNSFQFGGNNLEFFQNNPPPLAWSRDSRFVALRTGFQDKRVRIIDVVAGKQTREWDGGPSLGSSPAMSWDPSGRRLATCFGNPPKIQLWNVTSGEEEQALPDDVLNLRDMAWSPDGRRLAFLLLDKAFVFDLNSKTSLPLQSQNGGRGERLVWKPDSTQLGLLGEGSYGKGSLEFFDPATGRLMAGERAPRPNPDSVRAKLDLDAYNLSVKALVWNDGGLQASGYAQTYPGSGAVLVWDAQTGRSLYTLAGGTVAHPVARLAAWAPDSKTLATLSGSYPGSGSIDLWDVATGRKSWSLAAGPINSHGAMALGFSPDGESLASALQTIQVWKVALPVLPMTLQHSRQGKRDPDRTYLAWSPDSAVLAVLECYDSEKEATLTAWDMTTGRERFSWKRPCEYFRLQRAVAWSPDGKRIAWAGPGAGVWNVAAGKDEFPLAGHTMPVLDVQWSVDGRRVMSRSETDSITSTYELKVWDAANGQEIFTLRGRMAGWLPAPDFNGLATPISNQTPADDTIIWDIGAR
jgi:WD40 repeat protein